MFSNLKTVGLLIISIIVGVSSQFHYLYCEPMNADHVTKCFFYHSIEESKDDDLQNVTLCLKPEETIRIVLNDTRVQNEQSFDLTGLVEINKWSFLNITIRVRKRSSGKSNSVQYILTGKSFQEFDLAENPTDFNQEIGLTFHGKFVGSLYEVDPCVTQSDPFYEPVNSASSVYQTIAIVSLLFTGLFAAVIIFQFRKALETKKEIEKKTEATGSRSKDSYYGNYVNKKIQPEYQEGEYQDDTYELEPTEPREQTIEEKAKALNKSVIEVHFGL